MEAVISRFRFFSFSGFFNWMLDVRVGLLIGERIMAMKWEMSSAMGQRLGAVGVIMSPFLTAQIRETSNPARSDEGTLGDTVAYARFQSSWARENIGTQTNSAR